METTNNILEKLKPIFIDVLDIDTIVLKNETTAHDIAEWDSISNIQLIVAIERFFKVKFTTMEIQDLKNVGEMCELIIKKCIAKESGKR